MNQSAAGSPATPLRSKNNSYARRRISSSRFTGPRLAALAWVFFAIGPGAVWGNDFFGKPNEGVAGWVLSLPSIWAWQILWWALGVLVIWFLAYRMGMSTAPVGSVDYHAANEWAGAHLADPLRCELKSTRHQAALALALFTDLLSYHRRRLLHLKEKAGLTKSQPLPVL